MSTFLHVYDNSDSVISKRVNNSVIAVWSDPLTLSEESKSNDKQTKTSLKKYLKTPIFSLKTTLWNPIKVPTL